MRRLGSLLPISLLSISLFPAAVLLTLGWTSASAVAQDCCHASARQAAHPAAGASAPAPLQLLSSGDLRREFNAARQKIRIVALLPPARAECQLGHAVVGRVLQKFPSPRLQALLVWEPMRVGDTPVTAAEQADTVRDARIAQGWNGSRDVGKLFEATLDLHPIAWDVYLIYRPGILWEGEQPPPPTFWMHQLDDADPSLLLCANSTRFSSEVGKLLNRPIDRLWLPRVPCEVANKMWSRYRKGNGSTRVDRYRNEARALSEVILDH
ncbi:MAG TPA: hypothetical protein VK812_00625 [Candidatus Binatus sp.]|nr:hypothetical protein [Candidatus Binatus sp.]